MTDLQNPAPFDYAQTFLNGIKLRTIAGVSCGLAVLATFGAIGSEIARC